LKTRLILESLDPEMKEKIANYLSNLLIPVYVENGIFRQYGALTKKKKKPMAIPDLYEEIEFTFDVKPEVAHAVAYDWMENNAQPLQDVIPGKQY